VRCLLILSLVGCGEYPTPNFEVDNANVYTEVEGVDQAQVAAALQYTYEEFEAKGIGIKKIRKNHEVNITFVAKPIPCKSNGEDKLCAGVYYYYDNVYVEFLSPCIGRTALVHELVHWILSRKEMDADGDHNDGRWYVGESCVTYLANLRLQNEFCSTTTN